MAKQRFLHLVWFQRHWTVNAALKAKRPGSTGQNDSALKTTASVANIVEFNHGAGLSVGVYLP